MKYLLALAVFLTGCTTMVEDNNHTNQFPVVSWITLENPTHVCSILIGRKTEACSIRTASGSRCIIFTGKITKEEYLGHETKHCFKGQFH